MESIKSSLVCIRTGQNYQLIDPDEIICCLVKNRRVNIFLSSNECIETTHNLKEIEVKIKHRPFIKCNASCLINYNKRIIFDSKNRILELQNKMRIPVSRRRNSVIIRLMKIQEIHL